MDREDLGLLPPEFCQLDCQVVRVTLAGAEADWDKMDGKLAKFFDREVYSVEIMAAKDKDGAYGVQMNDGDIVISRKLVRAPKGTEEKSGKRSKKDRKEKETSSDSDGKSDKTTRCCTSLFGTATSGSRGSWCGWRTATPTPATGTPRPRPSTSPCPGPSWSSRSCSSGPGRTRTPNRLIISIVFLFIFLCMEIFSKKIFICRRTGTRRCISPP